MKPLLVLALLLAAPSDLDMRLARWRTVEMPYQAAGLSTNDRQTIAKLVEGGKMGYLEPAAYDRTVKTLLTGKSDPVITKKPEGAWTHKLWEAAQK